MLFSDPDTGPAETLVAELRDYPEWHRGRERYGVWILPVVQPELLDYVAYARESLADLLHPSPHRQPHMTVFVCGFHQARKRADDDFSRNLLRRQLLQLSGHAGRRMTLPLARLDSFASAAFIPVDDRDGRIARWRALLGDISDEVRQSTYVPHITLGLYRRKVDAHTIRQRLAALAIPPASLEASELQYVTYAARDQLGPLRVHRRWLLSGSDITVPA
ncbi:2'-5' RNA ligase family protein [Dyella amyloliquefaciens]|uniref:2'-5' RNA ligase family protein n=1 Tax=Dyella amyloliquefaciens TaxID=1770545 RepID=UPI0013EE61D0|nr:2'-5' RNA ligase family protein [Dyella amyloliquefaciens]